MASGKKHSKSTLRTGIVIAGISIVTCVQMNEPGPLWLIVGAFLGHIITPDIDHHKVTREENRMYRVSWLWGTLWHYWWTPYQWLFKHRGISHWYVIGTLTRMAYFLWPIMLSRPQYTVIYGYILLAWCIQDYMHNMLDL